MLEEKSYERSYVRNSHEWTDDQRCVSTAMPRRPSLSCKGMLAVIVAIAGMTAFADTPTITAVTAQQRYPWNGKVDISYTVTGDIMEEAKQQAVLTSLKVSAIDMVANTTNAATQLSGDVSLEEGTHAIVWDMDAEGFHLPFKSSNMVFNVSCEITPAMYCVIDLSGGANATSYPIIYMAEPPNGGFNVDEYKTTKLVLRRIEAGTFIMGEDQTDESHRVTLTKPFFCGLFEMTQKQYELVTGEKPCSSTSCGTGNTYPVYYVSYNKIRGSSDGAKWPLSSAVDASSFIGKLRARTGLDFDLPTEAQWEYSCRAGTTTTFSYGDSADGTYMWYEGNSGSKTHPVGAKKPNSWGLYDMHGNVLEWCLDWYAYSQEYVTNPQGPSSGTERVIRSGSYYFSLGACTSSYRNMGQPSHSSFSAVSNGQNGFGFRLVRTMSDARNEEDFGMICYGKSGVLAIDIMSSTKTTAQTERVCYSTMWVNGTGADTVAVVEVNGETLSSTIGSGYVDWTPMSNGIYVLTHKVMSGGEQIGDTLTATFIAEGLNPEAPVISPENRTTFEGSLSVSMSCPTEGATIHFTTNGTEPTAESPVYKRFKIYGKTTVKAVAEKDGMLSEVVTAEYALGQCADPVFSLADGAEFEHSNQEVSIAWNNDGVLRYTLDGSEPTVESPIYEGPFSFSESVVVKAKVFSDDFFDSSVVTASLTRVWVNVATPVVDAAASFTGSKTKVSISCATEGAVVRYTLDGSEPNSHSTKYTGPFYVTDSCTVKVYAVMPDYLNSEVATFAIEKVWAIGDTMGKPDHGFTTGGDGDAGWTRVTDAMAPNGEAMKSGAIGNSSAYGSFARTVLSTTVMGPGTVSFSWKAFCEDDAPEYQWDHGEFAVDGVVKAYISGETDWTNVSVAVTGPGEHTLTWTYLKDDVESEGEDCIWVGGFGWESAEPYTHTTEVPVPYAWLTAHDPDVVDEYEAYEASAKKTAANGRKVWECYVVGLDPQTMDEFKISAFPMKADGTPDLENIAVDPPQSQWNVPGARAVVKGAATLGGEWKAVEGATAAEKAAMRFFKVVVEVQ